MFKLPIEVCIHIRTRRWLSNPMLRRFRVTVTHTSVFQSHSLQFFIGQEFTNDFLETLRWSTNTNGARSLLFRLFPSTLEIDIFSQQLVSGFIKISVEHICFSSPSWAKVWNSRFWLTFLWLLNHANSSCKDRAAHSRLSTIGTWYPFSICNLGQLAWEQTGSWCQGGTM